MKKLFCTHVKYHMLSSILLLASVFAGSVLMESDALAFDTFSPVAPRPAPKTDWIWNRTPTIPSTYHSDETPAPPTPTAAPTPVLTTPAPEPEPEVKKEEEPPKQEEAPKEEEPRGVAYIKQAGRFGLGLAYSFTAAPLSMKLFFGKYASMELQGPFLGFPPFYQHFGGKLYFLLEGGALYDGDTVDLSFQLGVGGGFSQVSIKSDDWRSYQSVDGSPYYRNDSQYHDFLDRKWKVFAGGNVGLQLLFKDVPIDVVLAYEPGVEVRSFSEFDVEPFWFGFSFSTRYYF